MSEINIPAGMWKDFLETFTGLHEGGLVRLETHDRQTDETVASPVSALQSVELDLEDEKNPRINVTVHYDSKELKQILFKPSHVTWRIRENDGEDSLQISSVHTETTLRLVEAEQ
jgi:hypothetical protein